MVCPYCGRETIQPEAMFCDRCGLDLSNFWKTVGPLLRQLSTQQTSLDEQTETVKALNERLKTLEPTTPAAVPESKPDTAATPNVPDSTPTPGPALPETNLKAPSETPGDQRETAPKSTGSLFRRFFAASQKGAEKTAPSPMENKCKACGYNNRADANFCKVCGASLIKGET